MDFPTFSRLFTTTSRELVNSGLDSVVQTGAVSNVLTSTILGRLAELSEQSRQVYANSFPQTASGIWLDLIGEKYGLTRGGPIAAVVFAEDRNLRIKARRGSLRERIGTTIAAGTTITNSDRDITYVLPATEVPAGVTEMFLTAFCDTVGTTGNINRGELSLTSLNASDIEVTNLLPVINGSDGESDNLFRSRILNVSRGAGNTTASEILSTVGAIPGVVQVFMLDNVFGVNHPALVVSGTGRIGQGLINQAQAIANSLLPFGTRVQVIGPRYIEVELSAMVKARQGVSKEALQNSITSQLRAFIDSTPVGSDLEIDALDAALTRSFTEVLDVPEVRVLINGREFGGDVVTAQSTDKFIVSNVTVNVL